MIRLLFHGLPVPQWLQKVTARRVGAVFGSFTTIGLVAVWNRGGYYHCKQLLPGVTAVFYLRNCDSVNIEGQGKGVIVHS